ncbi:autotransporter assembly complex protein TamA [Ancylobacter amanitiformis]|uniref:Translocation and assembly module TamA n=1 Tax=Ancylobacter amanitiformis TaxID=217069 RepID=A0ABU0LXB6_9HYPH|nr:autotransporter assembly complex family protein [Ancylobacter amanitiformis]MDQ0513364.1 translocation and assembly module TamA [Ancylobacter amanitiformis]
MTRELDWLMRATIAASLLLAPGVCWAQGQAQAQARASTQDAAQSPAGEPQQVEQPSLLNSIVSLFNPQRLAQAGPQAPDATPYTVEIVVKGGDRDLRNAVEAASDLETLKNRPPSGAAGLVRRALADQGTIISTLYASGFYAGIVRLRIAGNAPDAPNIFEIVDAARARGPVPVRVEIDPGPLFHFGKIAILDAATRRPLTDTPTLARLRLMPGEPALASSVVRAEGMLVDNLRRVGHPFARVTDKDVVADHATKLLDVSFQVAPGPAATFGKFTVKGADFLTPGFIEQRIEIAPGTPYSPEALTRLRRRLLGYESIASVRIHEADTLAPDGSLPITLEIEPRKPRYVGFGATYSSTDGSAVNVFWGHRNLFGGGETLRLDAQTSWFGEKSEAVPDADPFGYKVSASFMKPGILTVQDDLVAQAAVLREVTNAYVREAVTLIAGVRHRYSDQLSLQVSLDLEQSHVQDADGTGDYGIVGIPFDLKYDTTDNELDPTKGVRFAGTLEPFAYLGDAGSGPTLFKGAFSTYHAFDDESRFILAGRVAAGSVFGASLYDIPPQRRFYVGGGGSLRGYDYQSASPRNAEGILIGGRSFFEASLEGRIRVTDTIGIVPFFDMGSAFASEWPDFDMMKYSAGIGLRYYTAIGPLRLDLAFPLNPGPDDGTFGLYVSLGQAF